MIKYLLFFLLPFSLYASKILSYNIYDRTDRVDVMITFDTPYNGVIKENMSDSTITIKLQDASIESTKIKQLSSKFIKSLSITPMSGYTKIVALVPETVNLSASKTSDAYGLRLRFSTKIPPTTYAKPSIKKQAAPSSFSSTPASLSSLPTKKNDDIEQSYYIVISILVAGIILLFFLKKRVGPTVPKNQQSSWLFNDKIPSKKTTQKHTNDNISIRFQKQINRDNSIVMLDFGEVSYLVMMGKSNILLDKFNDAKPATQDDFETILQSRHEELDNFLHDDVQISKNKEPLQAYKERAASIAYEV